MPESRYSDLYNPPTDGAQPYPVDWWDDDVTIQSGVYRPQAEYVICWSDGNGHFVSIWSRANRHGAELRRHCYPTASDMWVAIRTRNWRYLDAQALCSYCLRNRYIHNTNFSVGRAHNTLICDSCRRSQGRVQARRVNSCDEEVKAGRQLRTAKLVKSIRYADYH